MLSFPKTSANDGGRWLARLRDGLAKTREQLGSRLSGLFGAGRPLDEKFYEELETALISADTGVAASAHLLGQVRQRARREGITDSARLKQALQETLRELLEPAAVPLDTGAHRPFVIMLAGVNGSGKTTSIGKLAHYFQARGKSVLLAAGDTFRAAALEQLTVWGERNKVAVIAQKSGDPAAIVYDAIGAAIARGTDVVLADTAGRLPTQLHLMEEIKKVKRVAAKALPGAPHEVMLVLDANIGQNALAQVRAFDAALGVTGLVLTKLDGTAKGGVILAIAHERFSAKGDRPIPVRFVGIGEGSEDLRPFRPDEFVRALLD
jgi:fused signal recognition particle receptor